MHNPHGIPVKAWHSNNTSAPHGELLHHNSFFDLLNSGEPLHLLHITTNFEAIHRQGLLFPSGGCLVGGIYSVPLFPDKGGLRAHNLGSYVFGQEVDRCLAHNNLAGRSAEPIVITVQPPKQPQQSMTGVNYLQLGEIHLRAFQQLQHQLPTNLQQELKRSVTEQIQPARPLLEICSKIIHEGLSVKNDYFFALMTSAIAHLPILGYLYFEAVTEYIILFSEDTRSMELHELGELNCWGYKDFVFRVQPSLLRNFNLAHFRPSLKELQSVTRELIRKGTVLVDVRALSKYIVQRFSLFVVKCLLDGASLPIVRATFDDIAQYTTSLAGHAIDREIRNHSKYRQFSFRFDSLKAHHIWDYWEKANILIPFNGLLPKGEVSVNPGHSQLEYTLHRGKPKYINNALYIEHGDRLNAKIIPQLINPNLAFMGIKAKA